MGELTEESKLRPPNDSKAMSAKLAIFVVTCAFWATAFPVGTMKSTGVFFIQFQQNLEATAQEASLAMSMLYGSFFFFGPLATVMCNQLGFRKTMVIGGLLSAAGPCLSSLAPNVSVIYVTLGVLMGIGASCVITAVYALSGQLFTTKRPLANNVISTGSGMLAIPLCLLAQYWIESYGWRGSLLLLGALMLHTLPFALAMMTEVDKLDVTMTSERRELIDVAMLRDVRFVAYVTSCGLHMASIVVVSTYLVRYAQSVQVDAYQAASLSSVISACDITMRPIVGFLSSRSPNVARWSSFDRSALLTVAMLAQAATTVGVAFARSYVPLVAVTIGYGVTLGVAGALPITVLADLFGAEKLTTTLGMRMCVVGVFSLLTPPLVGAAVDGGGGDFRVPFYASTALAMCAALLLFVVRILLLRETPAVKEEAADDVETPK